ncbi:MAG: D-alanyl-D-alanine carboxypeptidase [Anaerotignum sp.]|nr:D-alanyl-D-alanine carboxypeptidase [Anaerotignum sp.]
MKRMISVLLLFLLSATTAFAAEPNVAAQGAALIDGKTGRLLWGRKAEEPMAMASTTKIMTAILVLENADLEEIVTVSQNAARQPEVHMELKEGEQWKAGDLLSAMMLRSYNDAAVALAEHVSGNVEDFCAEMTEKAKELGAKETVFGSPNGLDSYLTDEQHHSTAYDMSLIAAYALENEKFCEIIGQSEISVTDSKGEHIRNVTNADRFLKEYRGALGVKTGYTNKAGHCFVGAAERDGVLLVSTVLGSGWGTSGKEKKWTDTKVLMDYGFESFHSYEAVKEGILFGEVKVLDSPLETVETVLADSYTALFSDEEIESLRLEADLPQEVEAPVQAGQELGKAELWLGDEKLTEISLLARGYVPTFTLQERLCRSAENWLTWRKI